LILARYRAIEVFRLLPYGIFSDSHDIVWAEASVAILSFLENLAKGRKSPV